MCVCVCVYEPVSAWSLESAVRTSQDVCCVCAVWVDTRFFFLYTYFREKKGDLTRTAHDVAHATSCIRVRGLQTGGRHPLSRANAAAPLHPSSHPPTPVLHALRSFLMRVFFLRASCRDQVQTVLFLSRRALQSARRSVSGNAPRGL